MSSTIASPIDLRKVSPRERHTLVFNRFDALRVGEELELVHDHDPVPLRDQFQDLSAGRFDWRTLEAGPALWRVRIAKRLVVGAPADPTASGSCCSGGACGG